LIYELARVENRYSGKLVSVSLPCTPAEEVTILGVYCV